MTSIIILEVIGIYIIIVYASDMEVYGPLVCAGIGMIGILSGFSSVCSIILYMVIWPFAMVYVWWISSIIGGLKVNESSKNLFILFLVLGVAGPSFFLIYVCSILLVQGLLSVVTLGVYVFIILFIGLWSLLILYVVFGVVINLNYKFMLLGVIPLPVFFVKLCSGWLLLYYIMLSSTIVFL